MTIRVLTAQPVHTPLKAILMSSALRIIKDTKETGIGKSARLNIGPLVAMPTSAAYRG